MAKSAHAQVYDASLAAYRDAIKLYHEAAKAYRAREIDDYTFMAAVDALKAANAISDAAERVYIEATQVTGEL